MGKTNFRKKLEKGLAVTAIVSLLSAAGLAANLKSKKEARKVLSEARIEVQNEPTTSNYQELAEALVYHQSIRQDFERFRFIPFYVYAKDRLFNSYNDSLTFF